MKKGKTEKRAKLGKLLDRAEKILTFAERIARGDLHPLATAAAISGYSIQHLQRLCHRRAVDHEQHKGDYFFTPAQLVALSPKTVKARA